MWMKYHKSKIQHQIRIQQKLTPIRTWIEGPMRQQFQPIGEVYFGNPRALGLDGLRR